jgi:ankyrin repeat protein
MSKEPGFFGVCWNVIRTACRFTFSSGDVHVKAAKGDVDALRSLIAERPERVDLVDKMDFGTPLHWAAVYGQTASVEFLLEHGAKLEAVDDIGRTPLFWAIAGGEAEVLGQLLVAGANANLKDAEGITPIAVAEEGKNQEIIDILRAHGARE